jgi:ubiquinone/menaquinone biosynthesis C-methylase UbiE
MEYDLASEIKRDYFRAKLLQYTRKAFKMIPELEKPRVLDIGCGTGVVTLELARLSNGRVIGIDTDQNALDKLNEKIEQAGLLDHVKTLNCSMKDMQFPEGSYDIIWSEGAIFAIGFEQALEEWRRFIRPEGYLVLHARLGNIGQRVAAIPTLGYRFIDKFLVPKEAWWDDYYAPLEKLVEGLRHKYRSDPKAQGILDKVQTEVNEFKSKPEHHGSVFYIMQKTTGAFS